MSEVTYYFNAYVTGVWTDPAKMVDGILTNYGSTTSTGATQVLTGNDCPGTDLGTITKVEIRAYGYGDADDLLELIAVFAAGDGNLKSAAPGTSPVWSAYYNITTDTNAPSPWTWSAVQSLDCKVIFTKSDKSNTMRCARVEIRVTYEFYPEAPTDLASPSQTETTIDLTWTLGANCDKTLIRFKEGSYPTGVADGILAYFDTGELVTVESVEDSIIQDSYITTGALYGGYVTREAEKVYSFPISTITNVSFYLNKTLSPSGTVYIRIRKADDSILATIDSFDASTLTTEVARYDYPCEVENPTEQDLLFCVEFSGGDGQNHIRTSLYNPNILPGATRSYYSDMWYDDTYYDQAIRINYSTPPLLPATTYYFRAWGYQSATTSYSDDTADLTQATSGAPPAGVPLQMAYYMRMRRA